MRKTDVPTLHHEAEMIGKVIFIKGENTQVLCSGMTIREDPWLFVCKLCLYRSQNPNLARRMLADYKLDEEAIKATEEAAKRVNGITIVKKKVVQHTIENEVKTKPKATSKISDEDVPSNTGDDEISDEELNKVTGILNSFSPVKLKIRTIPNPAKVLRPKMNALTIITSLRRNLEQLNSTISMC